MTALPRPIADLVDGLLELAVVPSFSRIGPAIRRRLDDWQPPAPGALDGRTVLITGPTSGIGRAAALALAGTGARLVLVGRDPAKLAALEAEIGATPGSLPARSLVADLGSLEAVRETVATILATEPRLDVVVDNAGAIFPERRVGPDGLEATFGLLVVGPFVLVGGLLPLLRASRGRVIAVTSGGMYTQALDLDDLQSAEGGWSGATAYARAKRAQVALVREWARRLAGTGVTIEAMHPGWADTPGLAESLPGFHRVMGPLLRSPAEGADTIVWLATRDRGTEPGGRLWLDRRPRPFDRVPATRLSAADRGVLWDRVVALSGGPDPLPEEP